MKERTKGIIKLIVAVIVIAAAVVVAAMGIGKDKLGSAGNVKLGLDLAGGVSVTYETVKDNPTDTEMSDTVYKMQKRAESFSTEAQVYPEGSRRIIVSIPDVTDADAVLSGLGDAGNIYFVYGMGPDGVQNIVRYFDEESGEYKFELLNSIEQIAEAGDVVVDGSNIADAQPNIMQDDLKGTEYIVALSLDETGSQLFEDATRYCYTYYNATSEEDEYKNLIAIVYDNEVVSAPHVATIITGGQATISGQANYDESKMLATTIRVGALPLELQVLRYYVEGAHLGSDALHTSLIAGLIGFILIVLFMIVMYRVPGFAASIALVMYVCI